MNLEAVYYIAQTVAVIAIIGTLIALIAQLRLANKLQREDAERKQIASLKSVYDALSSDAELTDIYLRGQADYHALSEFEQMRYRILVMSFMRLWEGLHVEYRKGLIDDDLWQSHIRQMRTGWSKGAETVWSETKPLFTRAFQDFLDEQNVQARKEQQESQYDSEGTSETS